MNKIAYHHKTNHNCWVWNKTVFYSAQVKSCNTNMVYMYMTQNYTPARGHRLLEFLARAWLAVSSSFNLVFKSWRCSVGGTAKNHASYVYVQHVNAKQDKEIMSSNVHSIMPRHVNIVCTQVLYLQTLRGDPVFGGRCSPVSAHTRQCHGPHHSLPLAQTPVPPVIDGPPTHQVTA